MRRICKAVFGRIFFTVISLALQIIWAVGVTYRLSGYYSLAVDLLTLFVALRVSIKQDNAAYRIVWVFVILGLPIFGLTLYAMFGRSSISRTQKRHYGSIHEKMMPILQQEMDVVADVFHDNVFAHNQMRYIHSYSGYPTYKNTDVKFYPRAEAALEDMKTALRQAKKFIFMEYFAVEDAEVFAQLEEILVQKVKEGVEVRFIYDDFGSVGYVRKDFARRLNREGIQCRIFNELSPIFYVFMNNRDHRKITVVDGEISFSGGFNLADEYFNITAPYGHWKDSGIRLQGDAVRSHTEMFLEMWNSIPFKYEDPSPYLQPITYQAKEQDGFVQPFCDSPLDRETLGENVYMNILKSAKNYVYITTPYLIISDEMSRELQLAAKRGIDVRIIMPGIPDKKTVFFLSQSYYAPLTNAGVKIYQYTPGFVHAKQWLCDDEIGVVGTINMDFRSLYLHFECATFLYRCEALASIHQDFEEMFALCEQIPQNYGTARTLLKRLVQQVLRLLAPLF